MLAFLLLFPFFGLTAFTNFFRNLVHAWPLENRIRVRLIKPPHLRRSRARSCIQLHHKHALRPVHRNPRASARVLDARFLRSEHDDVSIVDGLLTSASKNFMLHFLPSRTSSNLASRSTCIGLPLAAASSTVFVASVWDSPNEGSISCASNGLRLRVSHFLRRQVKNGTRTTYDDTLEWKLGGPARVLARQRRADGRHGRSVWCAHTLSEPHQNTCDIK